MSTLLEIKTRNLEELERRAAMHGPGAAPLFLLNQIAELREELDRALGGATAAAAQAVAWRRQLAEARANLQLIEERKFQFVQEVDVPLQLIKDERRWQAQIADLETHLRAAGLSAAETRAIPAMALSPDQVRAIHAKLDRLQAGVDDLKQGQAAIYRELGAAQRRTAEAVLVELRGSAAAIEELGGVLDAVRRALIHLQSRQLLDLDADGRRILDEVTELIRAEADLHTGLELTIPLIPLLLNYNLNLDLGGGLDLRQAWDRLVNRARR